MSNSKALFYPSIEIHDEAWLKSSLLFWDELHTIVPERMKEPYQNKTTRYLYENEFLKPEFVNPDHRLVKKLSELIIQYLNSEEGFQLLANYQRRNVHVITSQDPWLWMGHELKNRFRMHPNKLSDSLQQYLEGKIKVEDDWLWVNSSFAEFYMTLLSKLICDDKGLGLLTDNESCSNLSEKIRLGMVIPDDFLTSPSYINHQLAQGVFINLVAKSISFHPSTNIKDIISFKNDHRDLLGFYRTNVKKLLKDVPQEANFNTLKEEIESIYNDEFLPSYHTLISSLDKSKIKWVADNFMKIGFFSVSTTSIPLHLLGLSIPLALLAGAGVSLVASAISFNIEQKNNLEKNPYSYLMKINEKL